MTTTCRAGADLCRAALAAAAVGLGCGSPPAAFDASVAPADAAAADAAPPDAGLPDLVIDLDRARADLAVGEKTFQPDACELDPDEDCVGQPGVRRLLHFSVLTPNIGDGDMVLGVPDPENPAFQYSECHGHYHFEGYAEYRLIDAARGEVAVGRKQAFCLLDTVRYLDEPGVSQDKLYTCGSQGIQRGWADVYDATLPCQFIDVTGVPDGDYTLEIRLNTERTLREKDYENGVVQIAVTLGSEELAGPTEPCPDDLDPAAGEGTHRECGWVLAGEYDCEPASELDVGCSAAAECGGAECGGDPMVRICDAEPAGANCSAAAALRSANDVGASPCPCARGVRCPASGRVAVYTAPVRAGEEATCELSVQPSR